MSHMQYQARGLPGFKEAIGFSVLVDTHLSTHAHICKVIRKDSGILYRGRDSVSVLKAQANQDKLNGGAHPKWGVKNIVSCS